MRTVKMKVEYEGTRYNGWQRQSSTENTIQKKLEMVFRKRPLWKSKGLGEPMQGYTLKDKLFIFIQVQRKVQRK